MSLIEWTDALSLRIPAIDAQHRRIIDMINALHEAHRRGDADEAVIRRILGEMMDYVAVHFETEEAYMTRFQYPEIQTHRALHNVFIDKIHQFRGKMHEEPGPLLLGEMLEYLRQWWVGHIQGTDTQYVACFRQNGLS